MSSNSINLVGEFYAMSRLFLEGYEATLTLGNTKGIDILLYNPKNKKQFKVEVKTSTTILNEKIFGGSNIRWFMTEKHENVEDDESLVFCFIFVNKKDQSYQIFLVPSKDVAKYCKWENKHWHESKHKNPVKRTKMRSFRIKAYEKSPYEDNFSLFE